MLRLRSAIIWGEIISNPPCWWAIGCRPPRNTSENTEYFYLITQIRASPFLPSLVSGLVVAIVAAHFALARSDPNFAALVAGCTASVFAIRIARRRFQFSPPAASAIGIGAAMLVSSTLLTLLAGAHSFVPVAPQSTWIYGDGIQALISCAIVGILWGFYGSLVVVLIYGMALFVRRLCVKRTDAIVRPTRRSKWQLAFTALMAAFSAYLAFEMYPYPAFIVAASMGAVAFMGIMFRVGWFIPCIAAGVCAGLMIGEVFRGGSIASQMSVTVTSVGLGAIIGCVLGLVIDSTQPSARAD